MKIAFIITGNNTTSIYIVTKDVIRYLEDRGHCVDVFFTENSIAPLGDNQKHIDRNSIFKLKFANQILRFLKNLIGRHVYEFFISWLVTNKFKNDFSKYDCIFIHGAAAITFRTLTMPHFVVLHSCKYDNFLGRRSEFIRPFYKKLYQNVYGKKNLLTVSQSVSLDLLDRIKAKPISIDTIYNGFDFERLNKIANDGMTHNVPDKFIMAAGRPDRTKRFDILLKAYARSKRILPLVIFGDGRKLDALKQLTFELGIDRNVIFWGYCNDLLPYFKKASAYILSSDVEGLPTVVIESLSVGTPVVATDVGGIRELFGDKFKEWIVPRGNIDLLAIKIDDVIQYPPSVSYKDIDFLDYRLIGDKYEKLSEKMKDGLF